MKFHNIDGSIISMDIRSSQYPMTQREECKSDAQWRFGQRLKVFYPYDSILEEFIIPKTNGLAIDFFIPSRKIAFEVNGQQHRQFVAHYHGDIAGFKRQIERDRKKCQWCEINAILLVNVDDTEVDLVDIGQLICKSSQISQQN